MLERIWWLLTQLNAGAKVTYARYRIECERSRATFKRDLDYLRERFGATVVYDPRMRRYALAGDSFELPYLLFDRFHLLMMLGACRQLAEVAGAEPREIRVLRERIELLLAMQYGGKAKDLVSFAVIRWTRCDIELVDVLIAAMTERRMVRFTYHTAHSGEVHRRTVEPYRLHHYRGSWHLAAFCHHRDRPRVFLLGRIQDPDPLDRRFEERRFDVTAFLEDTFGIYKGGAVQRVVLRFSPDIARSVRDEVWHRDQEMTDLEDGGLLLSLNVADLTEIRRHALMYGPDVEVLEPPELRRQVAEAAEGILKIYGNGEKK